MKIPEILMVETVHQPGSLAKVLQVIADAGLAIEHLTALRRDQGRTLWEITLEMDEEADRSLYERIGQLPTARLDRKSTRLNSSHSQISYAVFCLKKKKESTHNFSTEVYAQTEPDGQTSPSLTHVIALDTG